MGKENITPFLKWPGGKRWFTQKYMGMIPMQFNKYIEPFLGGGAVFFALKPENSLIADINPEVVNLYRVMRDAPCELKTMMEYHQENHSKEYYYRIREKEYSEPLQMAARTLYLNRTCFNGLYRVNKEGKFNVPIGSKKDCIYDSDLFALYAETLKCAEIEVNDFEMTIMQAREGDLVFADPPYASNNNGGFVKYNENLFTWKDQERLLESLVLAKRKGVKIVLMNADIKEIEDMYIQQGFFVKKVERKSTVAGLKQKRGAVKELLITSEQN